MAVTDSGGGSRKRGGEQPQVGIGGLRAGVGQAVFDGAQDQLLVAGDRLASVTNAGRRHRWAQASQPVSRRLAAVRSRAWKTARSCSLSR